MLTLAAYPVAESQVAAEERLSKSESDLADFEWTEAEETTLRHKIDWVAVPWVTVLYLLCVRRAVLWSIPTYGACLAKEGGSAANLEPPHYSSSTE